MTAEQQKRFLDAAADFAEIDAQMIAANQRIESAQLEMESAQNDAAKIRTAWTAAQQRLLKAARPPV